MKHQIDCLKDDDVCRCGHCECMHDEQDHCMECDCQLMEAEE